MHLVDLIGWRAKRVRDGQVIEDLNYSLVKTVPHGDPIPEGFSYIRRNISMDEAAHMLNTTYGSVTQPKC